MSNIKVELYYAKWCGHCELFLPEWDKLVPIFDEKKIEHHKYEADENEKEVNAAGINKFPTIMITKNNVETDYNGPRTVKAIMDFIENGTLHAGHSGKFDQCGGSKNFSFIKKNNNNLENDEHYKIKYLKYKAKYMLLKHQLEL